MATLKDVARLAGVGVGTVSRFISGTDSVSTKSAEKIERAMEASDNVVLMKVYKNFPAIVEQLKENDMLRRAVLVSRAGLDGECVIEDLEAQKGRKLNYLSTILTRRETANQDGAEERKECDKR